LLTVADRDRRSGHAAAALHVPIEVQVGCLIPWLWRLAAPIATAWPSAQSWDGPTCPVGRTRSWSAWPTTAQRRACRA